MKEYKMKLVSNGIDDCSALISLISRDDKTNYIDPDSFNIGSDFEVSHNVITQHNKLNLKRKYNQYKILAI